MSGVAMANGLHGSTPFFGGEMVELLLRFFTDVLIIYFKQGKSTFLTP